MPDIAPAGNLSFNSSDFLLRNAARGAGFVQVPEVPDWEPAAQTFQAVHPRSRFIPPRVRLFAEFLSRLLQDGGDRPPPPVPG